MINQYLIHPIINYKELTEKQKKKNEIIFPRQNCIKKLVLRKRHKNKYSFLLLTIEQNFSFIAYCSNSMKKRLKK